jgi:putative flippase GtrA
VTQIIDARPSFLDRSRYGRYGRLAVDLFKYGAASLGALALDAGTMLLLNKVFGVNYLVAAAIGFSAGLALIYALSIRYVFGDNRSLRPSQEVAGFVVTGVLGLLLNEALMELFVEHIGLTVAIAKIPTAGAVFLFNFTARRTLLFSKDTKAHVMSVLSSATDPKLLLARVSSFPLWGTVTLALLGAIGLTFSHAQEVWRTGAFFDTDDAMRAVQVRDLLAGQSWFDMTSWRLDPPNGVFSHWSRVVDTPLAGLELFFRLFLSADYAERATRLVFPLALLGTLFRLSPWIATTLSPSASRHLAVLLAFLSGAVVTQFIPGRIDHHAPQIVLLMTALGFFLKGIDSGSARSMAPASAAMALSIAISLENLPFFAVMLAALPVLFVIDGARMRAQLGWFSASALVFFPLSFAATVGPERYFLSACDAYSAVYFTAIVVGCTGLGALAGFAPLLQTPQRRAAAAGAAGAAVLATIVAIAPKCLGDPLGGIDPLVRDLWLSHVTEASPLLNFWAKKPNVVIVTALPVMFGLVAALFESARNIGIARRRWLVAAAVITIGFAAGLWQVRVFSSVMPIAMVPLVVAVAAIARRFTESFGAVTRGLFACVLCLAVSPVGLAAAWPAQESVAETIEPQKGEASCLKPDALGPLAQLPPTRVAASFDIGPYLLAYTRHSAFAGPYHRDNHGNRVVADAFLATPDKAEHILRAAGAGIVLWCPHEPAGFAKRAPNGLGAALSRGEIPAWLSPLPQSSEQLLVFALRP